MSAQHPPAWLDELVLEADGPPWLAMGLARVPEAEWLLVGDRRPAELAERARLLDERHDEVFAPCPAPRRPARRSWAW